MSVPPRTTALAVGKVLNDDYGPLEDGTLPDLDPFIETASAIVDRVVTCAAGRGKTLSAVEQELIERWLAAHCYAMNDQPFTSRSTGGASGSFQGQTTTHFEATKYGQMALDTDFSGCLTAIGKRQVARMAWLGKPPSAQIPAADRD